LQYNFCRKVPKACFSDAECISKCLVCDAMTNTCVKRAEAKCASTEDCSGGEVCTNECNCVAACVSSADQCSGAYCPEPETCANVTAFSCGCVTPRATST
jgi:hypothetical protein